MAEQQHWVVVGSKENYDISKDLGFTVQGVKTRQRKKAHQMKPGDKMVYYLTGLMVVAGIATIKSEVYEDDSFIWPCSSAKPDPYPWRFKIEPDVIPKNETDFVSVRPIAPQLQYLKKWPEKNWTLGFQGNVHQWPKQDYELVRKLLKNRA